MLRECEFPECGRPFEAQRSDARYCSSSCRGKATKVRQLAGALGEDGGFDGQMSDKPLAWESRPGVPSARVQPSPPFAAAASAGQAHPGSPALTQAPRVMSPPPVATPMVPGPELELLEARVAQIEARLGSTKGDSAQWQLEEALGSLVALEARVEALEDEARSAPTPAPPVTPSDVLALIHQEQASLTRRLDRRLAELEAASGDGTAREVETRRIVKQELATFSRELEARTLQATSTSSLEPTQVRQWVREELAKQPPLAGAPEIALIHSHITIQGREQEKLERALRELRMQVEQNAGAAGQQGRIEQLEALLSKVQASHVRLRKEFNYFINGINSSR